MTGRVRAGRSSLGAAVRAASVLAALMPLGCGAEATPPPPRAIEPAPRAEARDREREPRRRDADVADPRRIEIPAIGVSAPVIELGLNADKTLEVPKDDGETGWWKGGPEPGERGAAVIAGHVDSKTGPAVFYRLDELRAGDEIRVHRSDGTRARFVVARLERHQGRARSTPAPASPRRGWSPAGATSTPPAATTSTTRSSSRTPHDRIPKRPVSAARARLLRKA